MIEEIQDRLFKYLYKNGEGSNNYNIEYKSFRLTSFFKISEAELSDEEITRGSKLRFFKDGFLLDSKYYYLSNQWTDGTDSRLDIQTLIKIFNQLYDEYEIIKVDGFYILKSSFSYEKQKLSKPFLLLAGISGTGKTRFVREQAKATGSLAETYCLTPVRPDWHEPSDLLGYISRLKKDGEAEYIATDVLRFIAKAWRAQINAGLSLSANDIGEGQGSCLSVAGEMDQLSSIPPFWLCLDEMNLAPVEQYFADYLSILETREWCWDGDKFTYFSDPLLKSTAIKLLEKTGEEKLREDLGFAGEMYNQLWDSICKYGMGIPFNLIVAGTVNMDETTHGFSRKVIDRALSFDFGEFFPNDFDTFFKPETCNKALSYPIYSHANKIQKRLPDIDSDGQRSTIFLSKVNTKLKGTPFELAYRALNELLLAVICEQPKDEPHLKAVWDDFLMCKVLPRIEGDSDKLISNGSETSLLLELLKLLKGEFSEFWSESEDSGAARRDLYRENVNDDDKVLRITCRSKVKLEWMQDRLERSTFTSFWP